MKLIRVTAYVFEALNLFKTKTKSDVTELSVKEMKQAELKGCMWIKEEEDYRQLKAEEPLPSNSRLLKLATYFDRIDKILRVGGKLQFADLP